MGSQGNLAIWTDPLDIDALLQEHGLWFVTFGTFIEGDGVALGAGLLEHRGVFRFWPVIAAAAFGGFLSDMFIYTLGRLGGRVRPVRAILADRRTQAVRRRILARPYALAFASRFIPGSRTVIPISIGASVAIPAFAYAAIMALACTLWALLVIGLGHEIGDLLHTVFGRVTPLWVAITLAVLIAVGWGMTRLWRKWMLRRRA